METIFHSGQKLDIERKLKMTVYLPQICHFCGGQITKFGWEAGSLCFHSLDGNHDNWIPSNKEPCHRACHMRYHSKGVVFTEERKQNISKAKKGKSHPWSKGDKNVVHRLEVKAKISKALKGKPLSEEHKLKLKKAWEERRRLYGPSGAKNPEATRKALSEGGKKGWIKRRQRELS